MKLKKPIISFFSHLRTKTNQRASLCRRYMKTVMETDLVIDKQGEIITKINSFWASVALPQKSADSLCHGFAGWNTQLGDQA